MRLRLRQRIAHNRVLDPAQMRLLEWSEMMVGVGCVRS